MNNERQYPDTVVDKILQFTLSSNTFAYLSLDRHGILLNQGGDISAMGLPAWQRGQSILDDALFLTGYLPMQQDYEVLESVRLNDATLVDIHLFRDGDHTWAILVDKSEDLRWFSRARQSSNELRVLKQQIEQDRSAETARERQSDYLQSLGLMTLRRRPDGSFERLHSVARGFESIYPGSLQSRSGLHPERRFPFVENFLVDAGEVWGDASNRKRIRSGPWMETDDNGNEVALEAIALNWKGEQLLFLELLEECYELRRDFLQIGREGELQNELLEQEVRKQTREIRAREEELALRLVCAAESRDDGETGSHIRRLGLYSELFARRLGWTETDAEEIRIAAPMHDIGKIGIPDHILKKPGQLSESEFQIMKLHPEIGARILSNSDSSLVQMARDICIGHHEKWDGSGYPHGLSGEDIPISARIVAIVDVFDALIHKRVYKAEIPVDRAVELLKEGRGTHFDPELLDLFVDLKEQMIEIAYDYSGPFGTDAPEPIRILEDSGLSAP